MRRLSNSQIEEIALRRQEAHAFKRVDKGAEGMKEHQKEMDKQHDPLVSYCHTALSHGFPTHLILSRLVDSGHKKRLAKKALRKAIQDMRKYAHPETSLPFRFPWKWAMAFVFLTMIVSAGVFVYPFVSPLVIPLMQTGYSTSEPTCEDVDIRILALRGSKQLCYVDLNSTGLVKVMAENQGTPIDSYELVLTGTENENRYHFEEPVEKTGSIIQMLDYNSSFYGPLVGFRIIPRLGEERCMNQMVASEYISACYAELD